MSNWQWIGAAVLAVWFLAAVLRKKTPQQGINHLGEWTQACMKIRGFADSHATGRLEVESTEREPYGGEIVVTWRLESREEEVLRVRYSASQPQNSMRIAVFHRGKKPHQSHHFSLEEFHIFIDSLEEVIGKYQSNPSWSQ